MVRKKTIIGFVLFFLCMAVSAGLAAETKIGVVLLHGKGGFPGQPALTSLVASMHRSGFVVTVPEMPYSKDRKYDKTYEDAMKEINAAVDGLRKQGVQKVFVAGHSLGANAALRYGTLSSVDGIVAIAPGHSPESPNFLSMTGRSVERAREMIRAGKGDDGDFFADTNQGRDSEIRTKARIYLSWFDPDGPAVMPRNAAALKPGTALLWVVGTQDNMYRRGASYVFDKAPVHPRSRYLVIGGDHMNTPAIAADAIVEWIKDFQ